jgi:hypothetical protein
MDRLEALLTDTLAEQAERAPTGPVPMRERTRRARSSMAVIAASVIVLVTASIIAVLHTSSPDHSSTPPGKLPSVDLPRGLRLASFGEVSLLVPADLTTRNSVCGGPVAHEVLADDGTARLCPVVADRLATHPGTVVWFSRSGQGTPYSSIATAPAEVNGRSARRGYTTSRPDLGDGVSALVILTAQRVTIGVTAPSRGAVDALLSSIRVAPEDRFGCAATRDAAMKSPAGPSGVLVPADPTAVVRCEYGSAPGAPGLLIGSFVIESAKVDQLTAALDALEPDPCHCVHGGTAAPGRDEVLYFRYRNGAVMRIDGTLGNNLDSYSNQTRTVINFDGSIGELLARLTNQR